MALARVSHLKVVIKLSSGLQSSKGLTEAGRSVPRLAPSCGWGAGVGCWEEALVLCQTYLPEGPLERSRNWRLASPNKRSKREQSGSHSIFCDLAMEIPHVVFYTILPVTQVSPIPCGKRLRKDMDTRRGKSQGPSWGVITTATYYL